ncbi:hypothetical protein ACIB24_05105 [Spongisporangium articulatum]|uniref:Uncharacterized protein n=1 Tax=Spongisporangium articulatum TaxID=3362603 RepID=A0ABW8AKB8_9ACTN
MTSLPSAKPSTGSHVVRHEAAPRSRSGLRGAVERDAGRDAVSPTEAWAVAGLPVLGALALLAAFAVHRTSMYWVLREDHPVEWTQFSLCAIASLVAAATALRCAARREYGTAVLLLLVAVTCFGLAGEEISWAQRVFNLAEPAELATVNKQAELNLHNTDVDGIAFDDLFKIFSFLMGAGGVTLALLARGPRPVLGGRFWWQVAPPLFTIPGFLAMALYRPFMLVVPAELNAPVTAFQEWVEFSLYLSLVATLICVYRRSTDGRSQLDVDARRWVLTSGDGGSSLPFLAAVVLPVALVTVAFATLTVHFGIVPGNVVQP